MYEVITRKRIDRQNGSYVEVKSQEYKTMSVITYWGHLPNGHLVGYSKDLKAIEKRLDSKLK